MSGATGSTRSFSDDVRHAENFWSATTEPRRAKSRFTSLMFSVASAGGGQPLISVVDRMVNLAMGFQNARGVGVWMYVSVRQRIASLNAKRKRSGTRIFCASLILARHQRAWVPPGAERSS